MEPWKGRSMSESLLRPSAFYQKMQALLRRGETLVLVTVVDSEGATPRGAGARMLVARQGRVAGTVGGGLVEYRSIQRAEELLASASPDPGSRQESFTLQQSGPDSIGMVCGGKMKLRFQTLRARPELDAALTEISRALDHALPSLLIQDMETSANPFQVFYPAADAGSAAAGEAAPAYRERELEVYRQQPERYLVEELVAAGIVYIFGGGHVAQALTPVLSSVFFPCIVLEDREEFLDPALFPEAQAVQRVDFNAIAQTVRLRAADYACIMTRGHRYDLRLQEQILRTPVRYIGVIGSRSKRSYVERELRQRGISEADLARVHTPVGVPVGGNTPQEIAISIAAQLLQVRNGVPLTEIP